MNNYRHLAAISILAFITANPAGAANEFTSSRADSSIGQPVTSTLPPQVPSGSIILKMGSEGALVEETRVRTCKEFYEARDGATPPEVTYSGGPFSERRYELSFGNYSEWEVSGGVCLRNHEYLRTSTPCPANQTGIINERRQYAIQDDESLINDTGWVEQSRTCAFYYVSTAYEPRTVACPPNQSGTVYQQRSYENWSDGSKRNYGAWTETSRTCAYYYTGTGYESTSGGCPAGQAGAVYYQRSYQNWSDGSRRAYSGWYETSRSCAYYYIATYQEQTTSGCPAGYTGHIVLQRSYQYWSDGSHRAHSAWWQAANYCTPSNCVPSYADNGRNVPRYGAHGARTQVAYACTELQFYCAAGMWRYELYVGDPCGNGN